MTRAANAAPVRHQRTAPAPADETGTRQASSSWLFCRFDRTLCALPMPQVIEIMRVLPIEPVAGAPAYVRGLSVVRGAPVPVVDLGRIVNGAAVNATRLTTIRTAVGVVALALSEVIGIETMDGSALDGLPPLLRDTATETIAGIAARDTELVFFLQASRIISVDVQAQLIAAGVRP